MSNVHCQSSSYWFIKLILHLINFDSVSSIFIASAIWKGKLGAEQMDKSQLKLECKVNFSTLKSLNLVKIVNIKNNHFCTILFQEELNSRNARKYLYITSCNIVKTLWRMKRWNFKNKIPNNLNNSIRKHQELESIYKKNLTEPSYSELFWLIETIRYGKVPLKKYFPI